MRALILAAGLGTRLLPLTRLRPKPALPVRGIPLVAYGLHWLAAQGIEEVMLNLHHLPDAIRKSVERYGPPGLRVHYAFEPELLDTGGAIRRAAPFLRASDPSLVMAADAIVDLDLAPWIARHRERRAAVTLLLRDDPRAARFGTIGVDGEGRVRRVAKRLDLGGERRAGLYTSLNLLAPRAFETLPDAEAFGHLDGWIAPRLRSGATDIVGELLPPGGVWEPVGTFREYLAINLEPPRLSYFDPDRRAAAEGTRFARGLVVGAGAVVEAGAELEQAVVWDGERVPAGVRGRLGVFAGGRFHPCPEEPKP